MTEIRQFATWDNGEQQVREWVPFEDFERLDGDAAGERAQRESWQRLAADREATIQSLRQEIECLRSEIARLRRQSSDWTFIEKHIRGLPWQWQVRVWLARFKIRKALRGGWRPTIHTLCFHCLRPIVEDDDEACLCTECGGRNRRQTADRT